MNKRLISAKYIECCKNETNNNDTLKTFLRHFHDMCQIITNVIIDIDQFDLLTFLEQISNNFNVFCNIKLVLLALNNNIDELIYFKHFIVYLGRLIKSFTNGNKSVKSLYTLEQLKIEYKISIIRENLLYFIQKTYPNRCTFAKSKMYTTFDEEVESSILKTFAYSVEIEKIENAHLEEKKKRKLSEINSVDSNDQEYKINVKNEQYEI